MFVTIIFGGVILFVIWKYFLDDENNTLAHLPGPKRIPFFGNSLKFLGQSPEKMFEMSREFNKLYGDRFVIKILKIWVLSLSSPKDIEIVLSHTKNIRKSLPYMFLEPWLGTGLLNSTGNKWHRRRKILTPTFHFNILRKFAKIMEEKSRELVNELVKTEGKSVDVYNAITIFTLNTICETAMGTRLNVDKSEAAVQYKNAILSIGDLIVSRIHNFWKHWEFIYFKTNEGKTFQETVKIVHSFAENVIVKRKAKRKQNDLEILEATVGEEDIETRRRLGLLDLLLDAENKGKIDLEGIREEVNTFMFEGHDTTAMALSFAFMLISEHEDVQEAIFEECQNIFGDTNRCSNVNDLAEMKYIEAVIKETLRLYPSVPFIGRRIDEDFMLDDVLVKKGTSIGILIYDLHHNETFYPEPETFKPQRFLQGHSFPTYAYLPFSAGPRNCIGQRFAMQEMKYAISEVCRVLKLRPAKPGFRPKLTTDLVIRTKDSINILFVKRK